jgi:hypothetical protein
MLGGGGAGLVDACSVDAVAMLMISGGISWCSDPVKSRQPETVAAAGLHGHCNTMGMSFLTMSCGSDFILSMSSRSTSSVVQSSIVSFLWLAWSPCNQGCWSL